MFRFNDVNYLDLVREFKLFDIYGIGYVFFIVWVYNFLYLMYNFQFLFFFCIRINGEDYGLFDFFISLFLSRFLIFLFRIFFLNIGIVFDGFLNGVLILSLIECFFIFVFFIGLLGLVNVVWCCIKNFWNFWDCLGDKSLYLFLYRLYK